MIIQCHACQKPFQIASTGSFHCGHCGVVNFYGETRYASEWEKTWKARPLHGLVATAQKIIGSPVHFFRSHALSPLLRAPLLFGLVCQTISFLVMFLYQTLWSFVPSALLGMLGKLNGQELAQAMATPFVWGFFVLAAPLLGFFAIAFSTALNHFILWILQGSRGGLKATFDAVCYAQAAQVFMLIPLVGGFVAAIYQIVLLIIGLKELHHISYGKSILTVLIPFIIGCGLALLLVAGVIAFILMMAKQGHLSLMFPPLPLGRG